MLTPTKIADYLSIEPEIAARILGIMRGTVDVETVPETAAMIAACYHRPSTPELRMHAINVLMQGYGCEAVWSLHSETQPIAEYVNTGDTYNPTILYSYERHVFRLTDLGTFVERRKDVR